MNQILAFFKSKTLLAALATTILANVGPVTAWVEAHVGGTNAVTILGIIFAGLRYLTTGSVADKVAPKT